MSNAVKLLEVRVDALRDGGGGVVRVTVGGEGLLALIGGAGTVGITVVDYRSPEGVELLFIRWHLSKGQVPQLTTKDVKGLLCQGQNRVKHR